MRRVTKIALILAAVVCSIGCIGVAILAIADVAFLVPEHTLLNVTLNREDLEKPVGFHVRSIPNYAVRISVDCKDGEWKPARQCPESADVRIDVLCDGQIVANGTSVQREFDFDEAKDAARMQDAAAGVEFKPTKPGNYTVQIHDKDNCYKSFSIVARFLN